MMAKYTMRQSDIEWTLDKLKRLLDADEPNDVKINRISSLVNELREELMMND